MFLNVERKSPILLQFTYLKMVSDEGILASEFLLLRSLLADSRELEVNVAACNNTFRIFSNS
jgi:hypothetical protein